MDKLFNDERSIFQRKINEICQMGTVQNIIEDLIKLEILKDSEKNDKMSPISELYDLFGPTQFSEIIEMMDGRQVQFPPIESFKETIMVAVYYYYKYLLGKDKKDIDEIFNEEDMSNVKVKMKANHLHQFIQKQTQLMKARKEKEHDGG